MKDIEDKSVDLILCDLPYGTTACRWDTVINSNDLWGQYERIIKDNGVIALFGSEPFSSTLRMSNLKMYKYDWIWKKNKSSNFVNCNYQPLKNYETISIFGKMSCTYSKKGNMNYYPQGVVKLGKPKIQSRKGEKQGEIYHSNPNVQTVQKFGNYPTCILEYSLETKPIHPTQKPVELCEYMIKTYTNENSVVLDNCMGSGTTGVACMNTNRKFIGIELDNTYFKLAEERINNVKERE